MHRFVVAALVAIVLAGVMVAPSPAADILGGQLASEEYPFMVSVQHPNGANGTHFCGGSLVAKNVVLTAAHCAGNKDPKTYQVMLGSHKLSDPGTRVDVVSVEPHPDYKTYSTHDVALLYLAKKVKAPTIQIAGPTETKLWAAGEQARVIGWGSEIFAVGPGSDDLKEVDVPVVSDDDCGRSYGFGFTWDPDTMVCAGETTGGKDSCQGDSGGPLMVKNAKGRWIQFGVVSWGLGCGFPAFYGVYAEVGGDDLRSWVQSRL